MKKFLTIALTATYLISSAFASEAVKPDEIQRIVAPLVKSPLKSHNGEKLRTLVYSVMPTERKEMIKTALGTNVVQDVISLVIDYGAYDDTDLEAEAKRWPQDLQSLTIEEFGLTKSGFQALISALPPNLLILIFRNNSPIIKVDNLNWVTQIPRDIKALELNGVGLNARTALLLNYRLPNPRIVDYSNCGLTSEAISNLFSDSYNKCGRYDKIAFGSSYKIVLRKNNFSDAGAITVCTIAKAKRHLSDLESIDLTQNKISPNAFRVIVSDLPYSINEFTLYIDDMGKPGEEIMKETGFVDKGKKLWEKTTNFYLKECRGGKKPINMNYYSTQSVQFVAVEEEE